MELPYKYLLVHTHPSKNTEHGIMRFDRLKYYLLNTLEAPGAYQAEVPNKPVKVAPPTIVSAATLSNSSLEIRN